MDLTTPLGLVFLAYLLVLVPRAAFRTARLLHTPGHAAGRRPPPRTETILLGALLSLAMLWVVTWATARVHGLDLFRSPALDRDAWQAGGLALVAALVVRGLDLALRRPAERDAMPVLKWVPRTPRQWALFAAAAVAAGVVEEAAYRGLALAVLEPWIGFGPAVAVSAGAFGLAHVPQGWKSVGAVVAIALILHALVWTTGTLVVAMVVHTVYDLLSGGLGARRAARAAATS